MTTNDQSKNSQAVKIISAEIAKIPANSPMEAGTVGGQLGWTEREGKAYNMALWIVSKLYGVTFTGHLYESMTEEEKSWLAVVKQISSESVEISGK